MVAKINASEFDAATRKKLKLDKGYVPPKVIVFGKILALLEGLTVRDALWAIRAAGEYATGYRKKKSARYTTKKNC